MGGIGVAYVAIALPIAQVANENFCNFQYSVIPQLEAYRLEVGQPIYTLLIVFFITVGTVFSAFVYLALHYAVKGLYRGFRFCFCGKRKKRAVLSD